MDPDPLLILLQSHLEVSIQLILLVLLLVTSALTLIPKDEIAVFLLSNTDIEEQQKKQSKKNELIHGLLSNSKKLLTSILIANNFINITIVLLADTLGEILFKTLNNHQILEIQICFIIKVNLVTFIILFFGGISPKIYANRNNFKFANLTAYPLSILNKRLSFLNEPMQYATIKIENWFKKNKPSLNISQLSLVLKTLTGFILKISNNFPKKGDNFVFE